MFTTPIKIVSAPTEKNRLGEKVGDDVVIAEQIWAAKTEHGGRESIYASRIVNEGEIVYTIRWHDIFKPGMWVIDGDIRAKIIFVLQEGRRSRTHLKCLLTNGN